MAGSIHDPLSNDVPDAFRPHPPPMRPEDVVLQRYTFLPYVRTGIAALLDRPFTWDAPARASAHLDVPVSAGAANGPPASPSRCAGRVT